MFDPKQATKDTENTSVEIQKFHKWLLKGLKKSLVGLNSGEDTHKKAAAGGRRTAYYNTISYLETHFADELELEDKKHEL